MENPSTDFIIRWSNINDNIMVWPFQKLLLPKFFIYNNFSSFVRKLSTYVLYYLSSQLLFFFLVFVPCVFSQVVKNMMEQFILN
ncbi:Heat shock factor protein HSF8 [Linum perenne]